LPGRKRHALATIRRLKTKKRIGGPISSTFDDLLPSKGGNSGSFSNWRDTEATKDRGRSKDVRRPQKSKEEE